MMKVLLIFVFFALLMLSCMKKNSSKQTEEDKGCIERIIIPVTSQGELTDSEYLLVKNLFSNNKIMYDNFRFTRTYRQTINAYNGTYDSRNVYVTQYINTLPLFIESLNYHFKNNVFDSYSGYLTNGTHVDTAATLSLAQVRKLFINDIEQFDHKADQYTGICFTAEFGYFNLNAGSGNNKENIVKAWHIKPKNSTYPEGYYQDNGGERINYFNGIISFK